MIDRNEFVEVMKDNKELEKLVDEFGGVDKTVAVINVIVPFMEKVIDVIKDFVESFNTDFDESLEEEESLFVKAMDMCDVDVKWRYEYLDGLLCDLENESMQLYEELEQANVDYEIADRLIKEYDFDSRNDLIYANKRVFNLTKELEEVEYRYEAVSDLYDECIFGILENLD